jgi:Tfp pilus assembly protein PilN
MTRIIPEEINKILRKEYRLRFFTVLFFTISLIIIVNLTFVSSSYLLLYLYEKAYTTNTSNTNNESIKLNEEVKQKTEELYVLSRKIELSEKKTSTQVASDLFAYVQEGVLIQTLEIMEDSSITIRGTASTRQALIDFQDRLKQDPMFKDFSIPIETLARQKDVAFNVTFTYYEN